MVPGEDRDQSLLGPDLRPTLPIARFQGHWDGDVIICSDPSTIATVVERSTRFTMLLHLPRMAGYSVILPVKNGPAPGGYGALAVKDAIAAKITTLAAESVSNADLGSR